MELNAIVLIAVCPTVLWLYGEAKGPAGVRRLGAVLMVIGWCGFTAVAVHFANLSVRFDHTGRVTGEVHRYLLAVDDRLAAGDVAHVRQELAAVREGWLQATPSSSLYLIDLDRRIEAMRRGAK